MLFIQRWTCDKSDAVRATKFKILFFVAKQLIWCSYFQIFLIPKTILRHISYKRSYIIRCYKVWMIKTQIKLTLMYNQFQISKNLKSITMLSRWTVLNHSTLFFVLRFTPVISIFAIKASELAPIDLILLKVLSGDWL